MITTIDLLIDLLMVIGGARLTVALLMPVWRAVARLCAGSPLDHATRRLATWILR